ncbi:phage tail family protein, partial [Escherichia coli 10.0869]
SISNRAMIITFISAV